MLPILLALFAAPETLPDTNPLTLTGDIAEQLVAGVDRFLLKQMDRAAVERGKRWGRLDADHTANRQKLAQILGVRDTRGPAATPELIASLDRPALVGKGNNYDIFAIRWKAFADVTGEGLLLMPRRKTPTAHVIALPDADVTPEQLCGLVPGVKPEMQYARRLAESGCRVVVPTLIPRRYAARNGRAKMTDREFIYRSAFELGRHLIGYELQKVFAIVDWMSKDKETKIGVIGWGEGGLLSLYAGAIDQRIKVVGVSGHFGPRERMWEHPIDRNVFGLLEDFGDAELLQMCFPRDVVLDDTPGPTITLPSEGGAPATLRPHNPDELEKWYATALQPFAPLCREFPIRRKTMAEALVPFFFSVSTGGDLTPAADVPEAVVKDFDSEARRKRQFDELDRHNQQTLAESPYVRREFMKKLDTSSVEKYERSVEWYRNYFANEVIGRFDLKPLPFNPRSKLFRETDKFTIYQVVLDVFDDVIAYGLLILPKDIKPGEKRPVVVCQHGLEGRPEDCIDEKKGYDAYKAFATKLAERGFIVFAPQNLYIGRDKFRTLQRKSNPIKKTLFSVIVPQHQQITDWLKTLPNVDGERIAFYGLSYGGKTAMRVPPLVKNYCLSICSADFNEWVFKNASSRAPFSYIWTLEYEIFEWDLGSTFNYAEMAALIAPRPFMVERGHFDGVGLDEYVGFEFAKVRHLYQARLGIGDRAEIEWFVGPHTINGKGSYDFLHKHLKWAKR
ncbi:MAG: hypothetical protein EBV06_02810 [Planctomycetia bacterium]|nr:hypothetical protein [Planctomycetia bacterium]